MPTILPTAREANDATEPYKTRTHLFISPPFTLYTRPHKCHTSHAPYKYPTPTCPL